LRGNFLVAAAGHPDRGALIEEPSALIEWAAGAALGRSGDRGGYIPARAALAGSSRRRTMYSLVLETGLDQCVPAKYMARFAKGFRQ